MKLPAWAAILTVGSAVVFYAIEYTAVTLACVALHFPAEVTQALAACLPVPFVHIIWLIVVYRALPHLAKSLHLTAEPEDYEPVLTPRKYYATTTQATLRSGPAGVSDAELKAVARLITAGESLSYAAMVGQTAGKPLTRSQYEDALLPWLVEQKWGIWATTNGKRSVILTPIGRKQLAKEAGLPHPTGTNTHA